MENNRALTPVLWASIAIALIGAFMLYPIGSTTLNVTFVVVKAGMLIGIVLMLGKDNFSTGYRVWVAFSLAAVVMTILKWTGSGSFQLIYLLAMVADIGLPVVVWMLSNPGTKPTKTHRGR